ncbi:MAG: aldo/keto reductase [Firmicutes bacterium]|nr:aldo/keto reductase [Bacillota bacterium]
MEYIKLSENLEFSRIIQGFFRLENWNKNTDELADFMRYCIDCGVTTFDTAEIYGRGLVESAMGEVFARFPDIRSRIQLVSKTGIFVKQLSDREFWHYDTTYDRIINSCKQSLQRLHCDYLDLYLIHREDPCIDHHETARALLDLKQSGLVREIGVSNFDPHKFNALNKCTGNQLVTNQIECNPCCFEHFNSGMIDFLTADSIHPMIWSPLAGGSIFTSNEEKFIRVRNKLNEIAYRHQTSAASIAYAWLLYHPVKGMPISGSGKVERLNEAVNALDVKLKHYEWYEIYLASGQQILR